MTRQWLSRIGLIAVALILSLFQLACAEKKTATSIAVEVRPTAQKQAVSQKLSAASSTPTATPTATMTSQPPTSTATASPSLSPTATTAPSDTPTPSPTRDLYLGLSIDELTAREYGGEFEIIGTIEETDSFIRYEIRYTSDGLDVYGFLNAPRTGWNLPVAIVLHGYVSPDKFKTVTYTRRYADALAEAGYMVLHPNYRNHAPSDFGDNPFRIGYAIDILNLIAIVEEQSQDVTGPLRRFDAEQIHLMGHSMGGGIAQRVAVVRPDSVDAVMLYASMNGDEGKNIEKLLEWNGRYSELESGISAEILHTISPHNYFNHLKAPVAIHHSTLDDIVPIEWSDALCKDLKSRNHPVDCHTYIGFPHTFYGEADEVLIDRMLRFFERY